MAITKQKKFQIVNHIQENVKPQKAVIFITTKDLPQTINAEKNFKFRFEARKQGVVIQVCKNTLIGKSLIDSSLLKLSGQTYLAYLENSSNSDEVTATKIVVDLVAGEFKDNFQIRGSLINGEFIDADKTKLVANTPTKLESIATIAGMLQSSIARIARVVKEIPTSIARGVNEVSKKK